MVGLSVRNFVGIRVCVVFVDKKKRGVGFRVLGDYKVDIIILFNFGFSFFL